MTEFGTKSSTSMWNVAEDRSMQLVWKEKERSMKLPNLQTIAQSSGWKSLVERSKKISIQFLMNSRTQSKMRFYMNCPGIFQRSGLQKSRRGTMISIQTFTKVLIFFIKKTKRNDTIHRGETAFSSSFDKSSDINTRRLCNIPS